MTPDDIRQQIELQVVELIKKMLADGTMTEERAQQASQVVLDTLKPGMGFEELYRAIAKLDDVVQELAPVVLPIMEQYEREIVQPIEKNVQELILQGQYDAATKLAKQAISQDIKMQYVGSAKPSNPPAGGPLETAS
jgi:polyhydroxyalkanoate synthesis regulator phasin